MFLWLHLQETPKGRHYNMTTSYAQFQSADASSRHCAHYLINSDRE